MVSQREGEKEVRDDVLHQYGDDITAGAQGPSSAGGSGSLPSQNGIKYKLRQPMNFSVTIYQESIIPILM